MRKILKGLLVLLMLSGCGEAPKEEVQEDVPPMMVVNPIKTYDTLEAVNNAVGTTITLSDQIEVLRYTTINNTVAQVDFTYSEYEMCLRASFETEGAELAGTYGECQESTIDDYIILKYDFGVVVVYDINSEHRTLFIKATIEDNQLKEIINVVLN